MSPFVTKLVRAAPVTAVLLIGSGIIAYARARPGDAVDPPPLVAPEPPGAAPARQAAPSSPKLALDPPPSRSSRRERTPDLCQTDPDLGLPGEGRSYCAPVAVSNSLMWLAENGFEGLMPPGATRRERHLAMARQLGSGWFMGTNRHSGTGPPGVLIGISRYVKRNGYAIKRLRYQGWRGHQPIYSTRVKKPQLSFIASGLRPASAVFLHVGWYRSIPKTRASYLRNGGHWLTVVAHGAEHGLDDDVFVLHDPAPYAGASPSEETVRFTPLREGWLLAEGGDIAFKAAGYYRLGGGMHVKREGEIAVLDGVVVLEIEQPE